MTLRRLPDNIINQIAAGEVVGAPSSVIKELVENAIDAKASVIRVHVEQGGITRMTVTDNGCGIAKDDLPLSIKRHTTSKLYDAPLHTIATMGFRGEALPSIGSVSKMTLTSRPEHQDGWSLTVDAGTVHPVAPATANYGTQVDVENLFYATPARLKFLKTPLAETQAIITQLMHLSLAVPHIHITLHTDNKLSLDLPAHPTESVMMRAHDVLKHSSDLVPISFETEISSVHGCVGIPTLNKRTSSHMFFLVNNRCCQNKFLVTSVRYAFGDLIPKGRFPLVALWISLPPEDVDINAHPSKMDVRFRNSQHVRFLLENAIQHHLNALGPRTTQTLTQEALDRFVAIPTTSYTHTPPQPSLFQKPKTSSLESALLASLSEPKPPLSQEESIQFTKEQHLPLGFPRCQIFKTYIVSESQKGLTITDQHAAHERIVYERMKEDAHNQEVASQTLLAPIALTTTEDESLTLQRTQSHLTQWGFSLENQKGQWLVYRIPSVLKNADMAKVIGDFCSEMLAYGSSHAPEEALHALCSTSACHGSIRAGQELSIHQMSDLLRTIESTPQTSQCNHGRPTHITLSKKDIDHLFDRT
ncbi:MAG: DNA mismatch repair endonuclease MutL [Alphaproteobacteria bacterium]|nr:DNA mismatch repair endonuclease MutL [Alphaproteobacteria bacterium]